MARFQVKVHTGPGSERVKLYADKLKDAGFSSVIEGTEHALGELISESGTLDRFTVREYTCEACFGQSVSFLETRGVSVREMAD
jgi:hypothetical protein